MINHSTFGLKTGGGRLIGRSGNQGLIDTNTVSKESETQVDSFQNKLVISDQDGNPNLDVGLYYNQGSQKFFLGINNPDPGDNNRSGAYVPLDNLSKEKAQELSQLDLNGGIKDISKVEISKHGNGLRVEIDPGRFPASNGFIIADGSVGKTRGGPKLSGPVF